MTEYQDAIEMELMTYIRSPYEDSIMATLLCGAHPRHWMCRERRVCYGDRFDTSSSIYRTPRSAFISTVVLTDPIIHFVRRVRGWKPWDIESAREPIAAFCGRLGWPRAHWGASVLRGLNLRSIYQRELVAEGDLGTVREMAIEAFRSVLEHFPDAVTYDITGTVATIAIDAYRAMIELSGDPGDWRIVVDAAEEVLIKWGYLSYRSAPLPRWMSSG